MFVSMIQVEIPTNCIDEAIRLWDECIVTELEKQTGWKDAAFTASRETGQLRIFTLWKTEAQAHWFESTESSYAELGKLLAFGVANSTRVVYQIGESEILELFGQRNSVYLN